MMAFEFHLGPGQDDLLTGALGSLDLDKAASGIAGAAQVIGVILRGVLDREPSILEVFLAEVIAYRSTARRISGETAKPWRWERASSVAWTD